VSHRPRTHPIVAIDGPAGAGKSTVAKRLAEAVGFVVVDTGALYRAVALGAARAGLAWDDASAVGAHARSLMDGHELSFSRDPEGRARVHLNGEDITDAIRAPDIGMGASTVSAHPAVRTALLDLQRHAGRDGRVVLEGRDIGTVVFPDAELKFFLTARAEVRATRRLAELRAKGMQTTFEQTLQEVLRRDEQDTTRAAAPLRQAPDAVLIDNSDLTIDETVAHMVERVGRWSSP
jgi:cytidylate kinase